MSNNTKESVKQNCLCEMPILVWLFLSKFMMVVLNLQGLALEVDHVAALVLCVLKVSVCNIRKL